MTSLETRLRAVRDKGRKALVPYFVGGLDDQWLNHVEAAVFAGADAVEIGVPFSDPMMDGVVIQQASLHALERGTTLTSVLDALATRDFGVPLVVMTYFNIVHHHGLSRAAHDLHAAGVTGVILPDLSLEESPQWRTHAEGVDVATVLMVAPSTPLARAATIATASQGFCYAQARMAVTGVASDESRGGAVVEAVRAASDIPTYIGVGIGNAHDARRAADQADGVIVGSALVQRLLDGEGAAGVERFLGSLRSALD